MASATSGTPEDLASFLYHIAAEATASPELTTARDNFLMLLDTRSGDSIIERMSPRSLYKLAFFCRETSCALERAALNHPMEADMAASASATTTASGEAAEASTPRIQRSKESNIPLQALQLAASNVSHKVAQLMRIRANSLRTAGEVYQWFEGAAKLLGLHDTHSSTWKAFAAKRKLQIGQKKDASEARGLLVHLYGEGSSSAYLDSDVIEELQPAIPKLMAALQAYYDSTPKPASRSNHYEYPPLDAGENDSGAPTSGPSNNPSAATTSTKTSEEIERGFSQLHAYLAVFQVVCLGRPSAAREAATKLFACVHHPWFTIADGSVSDPGDSRAFTYCLVDLLQHVKALSVPSDAVASATVDATRRMVTAIDTALLKCIRDGGLFSAGQLPHAKEAIDSSDREAVLLTLELLGLHMEIRPAGFVCPQLFLPLVDHVAGLAEQQLTTSTLPVADLHGRSLVISPQELLEVAWRMYKLRITEPRLMAALLHAVKGLVDSYSERKKRAPGAKDDAFRTQSMELTAAISRLLRIMHGLGPSRELLLAMGSLAQRSSRPTGSTTTGGKGSDDAPALLHVGAQSFASFLRAAASWQEDYLGAEMPRVYRRTPLATPQYQHQHQHNPPHGNAASVAASQAVSQRYGLPSRKQPHHPHPLRGDKDKAAAVNSARDTSLVLGDVKLLPPTYLMLDATALVQCVSSLALSLEEVMAAEQGSPKPADADAVGCSVPVAELTQRARELLFAELFKLSCLPLADVVHAFNAHPTGAQFAAIVNQLQSFYLWWQRAIEQGKAPAPAKSAGGTSGQATTPGAPEEWFIASKEELFPQWALQLFRACWAINAVTPFRSIRVGTPATASEFETSVFQAEVHAAIKELCARGGSAAGRADDDSLTSNLPGAPAAAALPAPEEEWVVPELGIAVDMAWPQQMIVVEVNGPRHYQPQSLRQVAALLSRLSSHQGRVAKARRDAWDDERRGKRTSRNKHRRQKAADLSAGSGFSSSSSGSDDSDSDGEGSTSRSGLKGRTSGATDSDGVFGSSRQKSSEEQCQHEDVAVMVNGRAGNFSRSRELLPSTRLRDAALRACGYTVVRISCHDIYVLSAAEAESAGVLADADIPRDGGEAPIQHPRSPAEKPGYYWTVMDPKATLHRLLDQAGVWSTLIASLKAGQP